MEKRYTSIEEAVELPSFSSISISEDGGFAAFVKRTVDWKDNAYRSHVWVYEKEGERLYPLTTGKSESNSPAWSPNRNNLAYTMSVGEGEDKRNEIFLKTYNQFNGIQITSSKDGIDDFKWAPDGKGIYYTATEPDSEKLKKRKKIYGEFEIIDEEYKNNSLYYIDLEKAIKRAESNKPENVSEEDKKEEDIAIQLTDPKDFNIKGFDISPVEKKAVLICTPTSYIKDDNTEVYLLDIDTKKHTLLKINGCMSGDVLFSPDGKKFVYVKTPLERGSYKFKVFDDLVLEIYDLTKDEMTFKLSDYFGKGVTPIKWTNKGILISWQDKVNLCLGMVLGSGEVNSICKEAFCYFNGASITKDGEDIAYIKVGEDKAFEVYLNGKKITDESKVYDDKLLSNKRMLSWNTKDGLIIEGVLSTPFDFDEKKKYPLLVVIHGGPTWASFPIHNSNKLYPIEQFVEKGYIVLEPNYRGSTGYGNDFLTANYRMLGIGDYEDVISGVDMLIEKGFADKDRVGVMGWSQGGYISAFCSTYSDRFKAISVGAGISNWVTYYANTDITTFTPSYLGDTPWNDPEIYLKTSPMTYIKTACTPTLIQHGDSDKRVPVPNAYELYRGLQDLGVGSRLVIFKGMGHSPKKPGINRAIMEQNLEWFVKHV